MKREILDIILNNLVALTGVASLLMFYKSKRRKSNAEADMVEINVQKGEFSTLKIEIEHLSGELKEAYSTIGQMQDIIDKKRSRIIEISRQLADMEIKLIDAELEKKRAERFKCQLYDCPDRVPPLHDNSKPK